MGNETGPHTFITTSLPHPPFLSFRDGDGDEVGRFFLEDGVLHFEGNTTESARIFAVEVRRILGVITATSPTT